MKQNYIVNAIAAGALALTGALPANAQDSTTQPAYALDVSADLRYSVDEEGLSSQNLLTFTQPLTRTDADGTEKKYDDLVAKLLIGTQPGNVYEGGLDLNTNDFRFNLGYINTPDFEQGHALGFYKFETDNDTNFGRGFLGGGVQFKPDGSKVGQFLGAYNFTEDLRLEGTYDTEGNARGLALFDLGDKGIASVFAGYTADGNVEGGAAWNMEDALFDKDVFANIRFGEDRPLDARLVIGDTPARLTQFWSGVTGNGVNDLGDLYHDTDRTFKFDIGKDVVFNYFGPESAFLGQDQGDLAVELRLIEDSVFRAKAGYRLGDVVLDNAYIAGGADFGIDGFNFDTDNVTPFLQMGGDVGDNATLNFKIQHNEETGASAGAFLQFTF